MVSLGECILYDILAIISHCRETSLCGVSPLTQPSTEQSTINETNNKHHSISAFRFDWMPFGNRKSWRRQQGEYSKMRPISIPTGQHKFVQRKRRWTRISHCANRIEYLVQLEWCIQFIFIAHDFLKHPNWNFIWFYGCNLFDRASQEFRMRKVWVNSVWLRSNGIFSQPECQKVHFLLVVVRSISSERVCVCVCLLYPYVILWKGNKSNRVARNETRFVSSSSLTMLSSAIVRMW